VFSFVGLGLIGIGSLLMLLYNNSNYQLNFIPISELTNLLPYTWMVLGGFLSLAIPTAIAFVCGLSIIIRKNILNFTTGSILIGIWMISGIFFCAFSLKYFPEVQNKFVSYPLTTHKEQTIDLKGIKEIEASGERINIFVSTSTSTPAILSGREIDLNNIEINRVGDKLIIKEKPTEPSKVCLDCSLYSVELKMATSSNLKYLKKRAIKRLFFYTKNPLSSFY